MKEQLFSTRRFVPGHVLGAAGLVFGTIGMAKWLIRRHEEQVAGVKAELAANRVAQAAAALPVYGRGNPR